MAVVVAPALRRHLDHNSLITESEAAKHLLVPPATDSASACSITKRLPELLSWPSPLSSQKITFPLSLYSSVESNPLVFH